MSRSTFINKTPSTIVKLLLLTLLLINMFDNSNKAIGLESNWLEVKQTIDGRQFWDRNSLIKKEEGVIEISTKYLRLNSNNSEVLEENIYLMAIDCINKKYKDISINGKRNSKSNWDISKGDTLINEVISDSCKNALNY